MLISSPSPRGLLANSVSTTLLKSFVDILRGSSTAATRMIGRLLSADGTVMWLFKPPLRDNTRSASTLIFVGKPCSRCILGRKEKRNSRKRLKLTLCAFTRFRFQMRRKLWSLIFDQKMSLRMLSSIISIQTQTRSHLWQLSTALKEIKSFS